VLDQLGPPGKISALPDGFVFLYEYASSRERSAGVSYARLKFAGVRTIGRTQTMTFFLNKNGSLVSHRLEDHTQNLGFVVSIGSSRAEAANISALTAFSSMHRWGASLTKELPRTLNAQNVLFTGVQGVEQRGVSSKAGQHTLESGYATRKYD